MATYSYRLSGDVEDALAAALAALAERGYAVSRHSAWAATAETGSQTRVVLFGGFAPYVRLSVSAVRHDGGVLLRLVPTSTGAAGGLLGLRKVTQAVEAAGAAVEDALAATGRLTGVDVPG